MATHLTLIALVLGASLSGPLSSVEPALPSSPPAHEDSQRTAIDALIETAVRHGLPDARGAMLVSGTLKLVWNGSPHGMELLQREMPGIFDRFGRTNGQAFALATAAGLHLRLVDGSWLVHFTHHLPVGGAISVNPSQAREVGPLNADVLTQVELGQRGGLASFYGSLIPRLDEREREAVGRGLARMPGNGNGLPPPLADVHLWRAGSPKAADMARMWALLGVFSPVNRPDSIGSRLALGFEAEPRNPGRLDHSDTPIVLPTSLVSMQRRLADWAVARLVAADDAGRGSALDGALALAGGSPATEANLRRIAAGRALPSAPVDGAPLAERTAAWHPTQRPSHFMPYADRGLSSDYHDVPSANHTRLPGRALPPSQVTEADIDGLIALLNDPRPSRWIDLGRARTLGDNALRALASLLLADPRQLAGRDPKADWTDAERTACAAAIATWRQGHRTTKPEQSLAELPLAQALELVAHMPPGKRSQGQASLGRAWKARKPKDQELLASLPEFSAFLVAAKDEPTVQTALATWRPRDLTITLALAAWSQYQGDPAPLDAALIAVMDEGDYMIQAAALSLAERGASAARMSLAESRLKSGDADGLRTMVMWVSGFEGSTLSSLFPLAEALSAGSGMARSPSALRLSVLARVLDDQRQVPAGVISYDGREFVTVTPINGPRQGRPLRGSREPGNDTPMLVPAGQALASDLRWCDLAGWGAFANPWSLNLVDTSKAPTPLDPTAPKAERDRRLQELRRLVATMAATAFEQAGLPLPGAKPQSEF